MLIYDLIPNSYELRHFDTNHHKPRGGGMGYPLFAQTKDIIYALKKICKYKICFLFSKFIIYSVYSVILYSLY